MNVKNALMIQILSGKFKMTGKTETRSAMYYKVITQNGKSKPFFRKNLKTGKKRVD